MDSSSEAALMAANLRRFRSIYKFLGAKREILCPFWCGRCPILVLLPGSNAFPSYTLGVHDGGVQASLAKTDCPERGAVENRKVFDKPGFDFQKTVKEQCWGGWARVRTRADLFFSRSASVRTRSAPVPTLALPKLTSAGVLSTANLGRIRLGNVVISVFCKANVALS